MTEAQTTLTGPKLRTLLKEQFKLGNVKFSTGKTIMTHMGIVKAIPTGVGHSPIDCTDVKLEKVRAKFREVNDFMLRQPGVEVEDAAPNYSHYVFNRGTKKEFTVKLLTLRFPSHPRSHNLDSDYQHSWIRPVFSDQEKSA